MTTAQRVAPAPTERRLMKGPVSSGNISTPQQAASTGVPNCDCCGRSCEFMFPAPLRRILNLHPLNDIGKDEVAAKKGIWQCQILTMAAFEPFHE
jgi:hypothetical protein